MSERSSSQKWGLLWEDGAVDYFDSRDDAEFTRDLAMTEGLSARVFEVVR